MKKREFAMNRSFCLFMILGICSSYISYISFAEGETAFGVGFLLMAILFIVGGGTLAPLCYFFDEVGVSICYVFLPEERYLWKNVRSITVETEHGYRRAHSLFLGFTFEIHGDLEGKYRPYMNGKIGKCRRTKRLIEKYWDGTVTGYFLDDIKGFIKKKRDKREAEITAHLTDEIVPLEREVRREAREWMSEILTEAGKRGADIKLKYYYVTPSGEKLNSRPSADYTYTVCAESGDAKSETALLRVKLTKTGYRGERVYGARESLTAAVAEMMKR